MGTDKPLISILMAVYEPNLDWLREQLLSLNNQTYGNLRLYIRDDCSPTVPFQQIQSCVRDCISAFPVTLVRNEQNLGSNGTFERLTQEAEGDFFAYCDQDDVWLPEKLDTLYHTIQQEKALLVCSDMQVIDGQGQVTAQSITQVRRHHVFHSGEGLAPGLLFSNFVTGCTMLVDAHAAKEALPFCPYYVHDQYLALWCAAHGTILSLPDALIQYRIHGNNQTVEMAGVVDRESYYRLRIELVQLRLKWMKDHFPCQDDLKSTIIQGLAWAESRCKNWKHRGGAYTILKYRAFSPLTSWFEVVGAWLPEAAIMWFVNLKRKNKV